MDILPHLAFGIAALAFAVRDIIWLRSLAVTASMIAIGFEVMRAALALDYRIANLVWHGAFVCINGYQLWVLVYKERHLRFTEEERRLHRTVFPGFLGLEFRKLLRAGAWRSAEPGAVLASQGEPLADVVLIVSGRAVVEIDGRERAEIGPGQFVGEMSFVTGERASATVRVVHPGRCLVWRKVVLRRLLARNPSIRLALFTIIGADMSHKLKEGRRP